MVIMLVVSLIYIVIQIHSVLVSGFVFILSYIHGVLYHGYDLVQSWRYGSTLYILCPYPQLVISCIRSVLVWWPFFELVYFEHGYAYLGDDTYILSNFHLQVSDHLFFSNTLTYVFCKVFRPSVPLMTLHFRGHLLYNYLSHYLCHTLVSHSHYHIDSMP